MTDVNGTVVARYDYDPWGRSTTVIGTNKPDFNFTGLYQHAKSGLDMADVSRIRSRSGTLAESRPRLGEAGGFNLYRVCLQIIRSTSLIPMDWTLCQHRGAVIISWSGQI